MDSNDFTDPNYFSTWDYVVFAIMLFISAVIGIVSACTGGRQRTADEFLIGNRNMNIFPVAMSLSVSFISAVSVIGTPAEVYSNGTMFAWSMVSDAIGNILLCRMFLPIFFRIHVISIYEYFEMRFNRVMRLAISATFSIEMIIYMGIAIYTPALALNAVTGFSLWICVLSTGIVCIFYTTMGGMKAVLWTDTLQGLIMIGGITAVIIKGTMEVGGLGEVWETAGKGSRLQFLEIDPDPKVVYSVWNIMIGWSVQMLSTGTTQIYVQRMLSCGSLTKATQAIALSTFLTQILRLLTIFSGVVMYAYYVNCDPLTQGVVSSKDQIMPLMVMDLFAAFPGLPGLFLSAVVSASLSTLSSGISALSAITSEDCIKPIWPKLNSQCYIRIAKLLVVVYGAISIGMAFVVSQLSSGILQFSLSISGMISGCYLGVFFLGVFVHRSNSKGAMAGFIFSLAFMIWIKIGSILYPTTRGEFPVSVEDCPTPIRPGHNDTSSGIYATTLDSTGSPETSPRPTITDLYDVSYVYYTPMGCIVCVLVGMIFSGLAGLGEPSSVNIRLKYNLTDALFCCLPESVKKWMRCGVDKIKYREEIELESYVEVEENMYAELVHPRKKGISQESQGGDSNGNTSDAHGDIEDSEQ